MDQARDRQRSKPGGIPWASARAGGAAGDKPRCGACRAPGEGRYRRHDLGCRPGIDPGHECDEPGAGKLAPTPRGQLTENLINFIGQRGLVTVRDVQQHIKGKHSSREIKSLMEVGYVEGQNVKVEYRWAGDITERHREFAAELVRRQVAVILAQASGPALAAKRATSTIPIVFYGIFGPGY